jgi:hypothetical protein
LADDNKYKRFLGYCGIVSQNQENSAKVVPKQPAATSNAFACLVADEFSDQDEAMLVRKSAKTKPKASAASTVTVTVPARSLLDSDVPHPNITVRKGRCWADLSDDEEDAPAPNVTVREKKTWATIAAVQPLALSLSDEKSGALLSFLRKEGAGQKLRASRWSKMDNIPLRKRGRSPSPCCDEDF